MKLSKFISICNEHFYSVDMVTDFTDDLYICYCGAEDFNLTEEGRKEFSAILDLEVEWTEGNSDAIIKINELDNAEELNELLIQFFSACAGYVSTTNFNKWFTIE